MQGPICGHGATQTVTQEKERLIGISFSNALKKVCEILHIILKVLHKSTASVGSAVPSKVISLDRNACFNASLREILVATAVFGIPMNECDNGFGVLGWAPALFKKPSIVVGSKVICGGLHCFYHFLFGAVHSRKSDILVSMDIGSTWR